VAPRWLTVPGKGVPGLGGVPVAKLPRAGANGEADQQSAASGAIASRAARAETTDEKTQAHGGDATREFWQVFPPNRSSLGSLAWVLGQLGLGSKPVAALVAIFRTITRRRYGFIGGLKWAITPLAGVTLLPHLVPTQP